MSQQIPRVEQKEYGFSFKLLSDFLKVVQPTTSKETSSKPPEFTLVQELEQIQSRVKALNELCNKIENRKISTILEASECTCEIVVEIGKFKGTKPDKNNRNQIIEYLRLLRKVLRLIKKIATLVNKISPNPTAVELLVIVGTADAILGIIINSYDIIQGDADALDAILDLVSSIAELVPLTNISKATEIKQTTKTGCRAVSSLRRAAQPMKDPSDQIEMIHKLADIERFFDHCETLVNQISNW